MRIGLMFAGQGAQTVGMGRELYDGSPAARAVFDRADATLARKVSDLCFSGPLETLTLSENCQPAIYTMSVACLAALREKADIRPVVCGGLSLGEFAAACAAGTLAFEDGLKLVAERGRLMGRACAASDGAMAAVLNADPELVEAVCAAADIDVANYNCPGQIVVSGLRPKVEKAVETLKEKGVAKVIMLQVDGAFHSRVMSPAAAAFAPLLDTVAFAAPACRLVQNVVGGMVDDPAQIRVNLAAQVTGSVRWEQCLSTMLAQGVNALVELGPGRVLNGFMKRIDRRFPVYNVSGSEDLAATAEALTG